MNDVQEIKPALPEQLDELCILYESCKRELLRRSILQWGTWGNNYPDRTYLALAVERKELVVFSVNRKTTGAAVLNGEQSPEWQSVPWTPAKGKIFVIHAFVIDPGCQHKGMGKRFLGLCEHHAKENGYACIRLDCFSKNPAANRLYSGSGYRMVGTVEFSMKPEGEKEYYCYEKIIRQ